MPPPRSSPDSVTAAGDISAVGLSAATGGAGQTLRDHRPRPFWAIINAHTADNRYGFVRVDDTAPDTFPELDGTPDYGDGTDVIAYEINLRTDVPADGTVRVEVTPAGDMSYVVFVYDGESPAITSANPCSGCGWVNALRQAHCLKLTVLSALGAAANDPADSNDPIYLTSDDGLTWTADDLLSVLGVDYIATFTKQGCDGPCLTLTGPDTSYGTPTYTATRDCCGPNYAVFSVGDEAVCTGAEDEDAGPAGNVLRIKVEWVTCPPVVSACSPDPVPATLTMTITGSCEPYNGTHLLTYQTSGLWLGTWIDAGPDEDVHFCLQCNADVSHLFFILGRGTPYAAGWSTGYLTLASSTPFLISVSGPATTVLAVADATSFCGETPSDITIVISE